MTEKIKIISTNLIRKILIFSLIIFMFLLVNNDLIPLLDEKSFSEINWIYKDSQVGINNGNEKGIYMVYSVIASLIAGIIYSSITIYMYRLKKERNNSELANMLKNICLILTLARFLEICYIMLLSDLYGLWFGFFRYFVSLDVLGMILFLFFCIEIFYSDFPKEKQKIEDQFIKYSLISFIISLFPIFDPFFTYNVINLIISIMAGIGLMILLWISFQITLKIFRLKKKIEEEKKALNAMSLQAQIFIILVLLTLLVVILPATPFCYVLRTIKNFLFIVNAYLFYPAFIQPRIKNKNKN